MSATLYVVATPHGNLEDMSFRAVAVLKAVDLIAAEDTRHSRTLLQHYDIATPCVAMHEHNESEAAAQLVSRLEQGESVAVITDAGMPGISDPGFVVVRAAQDAHIPVSVIPGACSPVTALVGSGLATDRFCFEGFLPRKAGAREKLLQVLSVEPRTLIFMESPHRAQESLHDLARIFGPDREAALARELTKRFESVYRAPLGDLVAWVEEDPVRCKGEIVLVVAGQSQAAVNANVIETAKILLAELPPSQAARLTANLTGEPRRSCYEVIQSIAKDEGSGET